MKPHLAYVSPLPPANTGIADYSAALLPALAKHYRITLILEQPGIADDWMARHCQQRNGAWLLANCGQVDGVLYHVGNSAFHSWMLELLAEMPGVVVLHDFFLGGLLRAVPGANLRLELLHSHGLQAWAAAAGLDDGQLAERYPMNLRVLEQATAVIVHSPSSLALARRWYGQQAARQWRQIPLVRKPAGAVDREQARLALGIGAAAYLVCSFGLLGRPKRNLDLLLAWLNSALAHDRDAQLIFVGEPTEPDYQRQIQALIDAHGLAGRVRITGWVDTQTYERYLAAADLAVQLRGQSRGETSAAVLDCLNHRLPTLVNDHGSMADLPADAVHHLPDDFSHAQLAAALEHFRRDRRAGIALGRRGWELLERDHRPEQCAALYHQVLQADSGGAGQAVRRRRLWLDVSETQRSGRRTGIERVARALTLALCEVAPAGLEVAPVYLSQLGGRWHYRYAHAFAASLLGLEPCADDQPAAVRRGDCLLLLDLCADMPAASEQGLFRRLREGGTHCLALVHDLLPVLRREFFPPDTSAFFERWLAVVLQFDGAVCVSRTVQQQLSAVRRDRGLQTPFMLAHSAHGADVQASAPSHGMPADAASVLEWMSAGPSILMVGTLEPRKGHQQALEAFTQLWDAGYGLRLLIVGGEGWVGVSDEHRGAISGLVNRLHTHPQRGKKLQWLAGVSDECLQLLYPRAAGLLAASWDEGFGLPLIEAAYHGVPILARDIPVFREVAGGHGSFFEASTPTQLAFALRAWADGAFQPPSEGLPCLTWQQSAANLLRAIGKG